MSANFFYFLSFKFFKECCDVGLTKVPRFRPVRFEVKLKEKEVKRCIRSVVENSLRSV